MEKGRERPRFLKTPRLISDGGSDSGTAIRNLSGEKQVAESSDIQRQNCELHFFSPFPRMATRATKRRYSETVEGIRVRSVRCISSHYRAIGEERRTKGAGLKEPADDRPKTVRLPSCLAHQEKSSPSRQRRPDPGSHYQTLLRLPCGTSLPGWNLGAAAQCDTSEGFI